MLGVTGPLRACLLLVGVLDGTVEEFGPVVGVWNDETRPDHLVFVPTH